MYFDSNPSVIKKCDSSSKSELIERLYFGHPAKSLNPFVLTSTFGILTELNKKPWKRMRSAFET